MRLRTSLAAGLAAFAVLPTAAAAQPGAASPVFINEIHYDNSGTDAGEAIEVVAPEGTNLAATRSCSTTAPAAPPTTPRHSPAPSVYRVP